MIYIDEHLKNQPINKTSNMTFGQLVDEYNKMLEENKVLREEYIRLNNAMVKMFEYK